MYSLLIVKFFVYRTPWESSWTQNILICMPRGHGGPKLSPRVHSLVNWRKMDANIQIWRLIYRSCSKNVYHNFIKILQKSLKRIRFRIYQQKWGYIGDEFWIIPFLMRSMYLRRERFLWEGIIDIELPKKSNVEASVS